MKKAFITCLLGICTLLPAHEAKSSSIIYARILTVHFEGWNCIATSQTSDGPIQSIDIVRLSTGLVVRTQSCSGYSCTISTSGLASGAYVAHVKCTNTTYDKQFKIA